jgi:hypothetical protein
MNAKSFRKTCDGNDFYPGHAPIKYNKKARPKSKKKLLVYYGQAKKE